MPFAVLLLPVTVLLCGGRLALLARLHVQGVGLGFPALGCGC